MRTFLCVRVHTAVGHTDDESAQHFDSKKLLQFCLVLRKGIEPLVVESIGFEADALLVEQPRPPVRSEYRFARFAFRQGFQ